VAAVALLTGAALAGGCGEVAPRPSLLPSRDRLALGLTEFDPALVTPPGAGPALAGPLGRARARLAALRPRYLRVLVLWSAVQPRAGEAPNWDAPGAGGHSVRALLRAIRTARERAGGGYEPVVTLYSSPPWAARRSGGCRPSGANPNAAAVDPDALPAYRRLVESLLALGRRERVPLRYWSAWNEPNSALFLSPQRARCDAAAPTLGPTEYAPLVRTLKSALDAVPGEHEVVLGETASPFAARPTISTVEEFVRALPADVLCAGAIWAQHQYVGDAEGLAPLERALGSRPCPGAPPKRIWITETGVGSAPPGRRRPTDPAAQRAGCRALDRLLARFQRDPLIDAALQYTYRDDPGFPVGLADPSLTTTWPAYGVWLWWSRRSFLGLGGRPAAACS
jgi:hypothetical protein